MGNVENERALSWTVLSIYIRSNSQPKNAFLSVLGPSFLLLSSKMTFQLVNGFFFYITYINMTMNKIADSK